MPQSFIVRIYRSTRRAGTTKRRRQHDLLALVGTVEDTASGRRQPFRDIEGLWGILGRIRRTGRARPRGTAVADQREET